MAAFLVAATGAALAQDDADTGAGAPPDDAAAERLMAQFDTGQTDADTDTAAGAGANLADAPGPLAFGVVAADGAKRSGTANWTSSYNGTYTRYEISITGESYYYTNYATVITPAGDNRFCRSSSVGGKLLVYCADANGAAQTSRFGFITFKP
jgi:hypothetical protein